MLVFILFLIWNRAFYIPVNDILGLRAKGNFNYNETFANMENKKKIKQKSNNNKK